MSEENKILKKEHTDSRTFSYELEGVTLKFTLRMDVKSELKAFVELLRSAIIDIEEELNKKSDE